MSRGTRRDWTVLLLRREGAESHAIDLGGPGALLAFAAVVLALLAVGVGLGRLWSDRQESVRVAELEGEIERLRAEQAKVSELAGRLEAMASDYRRIRLALGGDVAPSPADVRLPELREPDPAGAREAAVDPELPGAWPLATRGFVTRSFGTHLDPQAEGHPGVDIAVPVGSYVRAAGDGVVAVAGRDSVYGHHVRIAHRDGVSSLYAHNSWLFVGVGDSVERLEVIALTGNTGRSTAPHLHFEVERDGEAVDPLEFVPPAGR